MFTRWSATGLAQTPSIQQSVRSQLYSGRRHGIASTQRRSRARAEPSSAIPLAGLIFFTREGNLANFLHSRM